MTDKEFINGKLVTEEQIRAWATEAEAGFDTSELKARGRGRPGRGAEASRVVELRLTMEEIALLDGLAQREGETRSEIIRRALSSFAP